MVISFPIPGPTLKNNPTFEKCAHISYNASTALSTNRVEFNTTKENGPEHTHFLLNKLQQLTQW
jgi:hypothetical protein